MKLIQGQESVRLLFRLRTSSAGLLADKKRCRMVSDERCVMCDSRTGEDVTHFLVGCAEFKIDRQVLLDDVGRIVRDGECLGEFKRDRQVLLDDVGRIVRAGGAWVNFREWMWHCY